MATILGIVTGSLQLVNNALKAREYIKDFQNAGKEQKEVFAELGRLELLLNALQKGATSAPSSSTLQQMKEPLQNFNDTMEQLTAKLKSKDKVWSRVSKRVTWTLWNKKEAKEYLDKFETIKSLLTAWLVVEIRCVFKIVQ